MQLTAPSIGNPKSRLRLIKRVLLAMAIFAFSAYLVELSFMYSRYSKATQLINSVQQLRIGITSFDEVRRLSERFGGTFYPAEESKFLPSEGARYALDVFSPYLSLGDNTYPMLGPGLRIWLVSATLYVDGGHLTGIFLRTMVRRSDSLNLSTHVSVTSQTLAAPEGVSYYVGEPDVTGPPTEALHVELRPNASSEERKKAFGINKNCLTSFHECRHVCELSPSAWNDLGDHRLRYDDGREKLVDAECRQRLSSAK
jgi:hypothetical protein